MRLTLALVVLFALGGSTAFAGRDSLMIGLEAGYGSDDRFHILGLDGQLGWISRDRFALFATGSLGILGAGDAGIYASIGIGGRLWLHRAFLDARIERMSIGPIECEETCSSIGANRYTLGIGVDALRGSAGGVQVSLKVMHLVDATPIVLCLGGYFHP